MALGSRHGNEGGSAWKILEKGCHVEDPGQWLHGGEYVCRMEDSERMSIAAANGVVSNDEIRKQLACR